jgi:WD40 repeat protein
MSKSTEKRAISEHCLPRVTTKNQVVHMSRSSVFCGKYSADGNMLALACQDGSIPVYWTQGESFRHRCTIQARYIGWTVIEVAFSPDHTHLCYGTWSPLLHHCSLAGDEITQTPLDLRPPEDSFATFGIFYTPDGASVAASYVTLCSPLLRHACTYTLCIEYIMLHTTCVPSGVLLCSQWQ